MDSSNIIKINEKTINLTFLGRHYAVIQSLHWANLACLLSYAVVILQGRAFSNTQIGIIIAVRYCSMIIAQPIIGAIADRLRQKIPLKYFCLVLLVIAFSSNLWLMFSGSDFIISIFIFILIGLSEGIVGPLTDSLAMQYINGGYSLNYSLARGLGSLIFAITCLVLSWFVGSFGDNIVLIVHAVLLTFEFIVLAFWPNYSYTENREKKQSVIKNEFLSFLKLIKGNKPLIVFLAAAFCAYMGNITIWTYMAPILQNVGGQSTDVGLALFVLSASEFPAALFYNRLSQRFGYKKLLVFGYFILFIQEIVLVWAFSPTFVFLVMLFEAFGGGIMIPTEVLYVNQLVGSENVVKGQSILRIITYGIGIMVSNLLNGILLDVTSVGFVIGLSAFIIFIGFSIMFVYHYIMPRYCKIIESRKCL